METLIVTGGAGFIGCNFVRYCLRHTPFRVVAVDNLSYAGSLFNVEDVEGDPRFEFVRMDVTRPPDVAALYRDHPPRWVAHFAAETHVDRSIDDPRPFIHNNVTGTFEMLEGARRYWAGLPGPRREAFRFLGISTDEVYGTLGPSGTFSEGTPYAPNSPYAASKAGADHLVRAYHETYGLPVLLTNCSNNYGPFQYPEKLIPLMVLNAVEGRDLPVYGDGGNVRDWLHVEDHCEAVLTAFQKGRPGEKYNVGARNERTNLQVVEVLCAALDELSPAASNPALKARGLACYGGLLKFVKDRPGHDRRYSIDPSKIEKELDWKPRHGFPDGLRETVRWYLEHRDWCGKVQKGKYDRQRLGLGSQAEGRQGEGA